MTDEIAKVLCRSSVKGKCPVCDDNGKCNPSMWKTFRDEAIAVLAHLSRAGLLAPAKKSILHR